MAEIPVRLINSSINALTSQQRLEVAVLLIRLLEKDRKVHIETIKKLENRLEATEKLLPIDYLRCNECLNWHTQSDGKWCKGCEKEYCESCAEFRLHCDSDDPYSDDNMCYVCLAQLEKNKKDNLVRKNKYENNLG